MNFFNTPYTFVSGRSAFDYIFQVKEIYKASDEALDLTEEEIIGRIFEVLTLREVTQADLTHISATVDRLGLESALNYLIATWYYRAVPTAFDYSHKQTIGLKRVIVSGTVKDPRNNALSGATVSLLNLTSEVISSASADSSGVFALRADLFQALQQPYQLKVNLSGYNERIYSNIILNQNYSLDVVLSPLGEVSAAGGQVITNDVTLSVPPLAMTDTVNFAVTPVAISSNLNSEGLPEASFSVTPDHAFTRPATLSIKLPPQMDILNAGDAYMVVAKIDNGHYELLDSSLDSVTKKISALTNHFSQFFIVFRSTLKCYILSSGLRVCVPKEDNSGLHPLASLLDKRVSVLPTEMPFFRTYSKNVLRNGGWDESIVAQLDNPQTFTNLGLSAGCAADDCPPLTQDIPINQPAQSVAGFAIPAVSTTAHTVAAAKIDAQAEQCKINPLASQPQIRLNAVHSTQINANIAIPLNGVNFSFSGFRSEHRCKKILFGSYCWDDAVGTTLTETFSHTMQASITGYDSSYYKNGPAVSNSTSWARGTVFSRGVANIQVGNFSNLPDRSYTLCYDLAGCVTIDINNSIRDLNLAIYRSQISQNAANQLYQNIDQPILSRLHEVHDPDWNETNCFPKNVFTVSGSITGLNGTVIVNLNNAEDLTLSTNGPFYFTTQLPNNTNYEVLLRQNPQGQGCLITRGSGAINNSDITNVLISCQNTTPDGIVVDSNTGRFWVKCSQDQQPSSPNCDSWGFPTTVDCANMNIGSFGGFHDWRIPTVTELKSLVQCSNGKTTPLANMDDCGANFSSPTINTQLFPNTHPAWYLTSTDTTTGSINFPDTIFITNFSMGLTAPLIPESIWRSELGGTGPKPPWIIGDTEQFYARCVRGP